MSLFSISSAKKVGKVHLFFFYALSFLLPVTVQGFPVVVAVTALIGIVFHIVVNVWRLKRFRAKMLWEPLQFSIKKIIKISGLRYLVLFWLLHVISLLWTENLDQGLTKVVLKSSFLYFPLFLAITSLKLDDLKKMASFFVLGCLFGIILNVGISMLNSNFELESFYYTYTEVSHLLLHPSYQAMPLVIGIALMLFHLGKNWHELPNLKRVIVLSLIVTFSFFIMLLSSKAGIASWFATFIVFSVFVMMKHKRFMLGFSILLAVFLSFYVSYQSIGTLSGRVKGFKQEAVNKEKSYGSTGSRKLLWQYSLDLIKENWIIGYGAGDVEQKMQAKFEAENHNVFLDRNYNSHNQFLDSVLQVGVLGLVVFALIAIEFVKGMRYYAGLTICILLVFGINLMVESMLERQVGVTLISWVLALSFVVRHNMEKEFALQEAGDVANPSIQTPQ